MCSTAYRLLIGLEILVVLYQHHLVLSFMQIVANDCLMAVACQRSTGFRDEQFLVRFELRGAVSNQWLQFTLYGI